MPTQQGVLLDYCLMINHYHLFIETTQANLSRIMQYLNTAYTIYYNIKRKRSGHLFQGRYKSILVEQDVYFTELTRYIHLNPVRAKIVDDLKRYRWSSYNAYLHNKSNGCVDIDRVRQYLGVKLSQYSKFVHEAGKGCADPLKNVYAGFLLGGVKFIKDKLNQLQKDVETKDFAYKRAVKNLIDPNDIIKAVAVFFKIDQEKMLTSVSRPMTAKKAAIYFLRRKTGLTNAQIGEIFNMTSAAASMAAVGFAKEISGNRELQAAVDKINCSFRV